MSIDVKRAAIVTGALAVTGFVCGAVLGPIVLSGLWARAFGIHALGSRIPEIVGAGVLYGGAAGAVLTPPLSWLLLRRVSLGRALLETSVGVLIGAGIALAVAPGYTLLAALGGFVVAALRLRVMGSSPRRIAASEETPRLTP